MIDGDSASSTELYAILSALSGLPIRQGLAVTGSVNQKGQVQPIGGVNEKIEGFYRVCKAKGLTGDQGVLIPAANVDNLMLDHEVVDAVETGQFHVYAVATVEEGIELLTGVAAGARGEDGSYPADSVFALITERLERMRKAQEKKDDKDEETNKKKLNEDENDEPEAGGPPPIPETAARGAS